MSSFVTKLNGLQFYLVSSVESGVSTVEELLVRIRKLSLHFMEVVDGQIQQLSDTLGLSRKLALKLLSVLNPNIYLFSLSSEHGSHDINDPEEISRLNVNVLDIGVPW